MNLQYVGEECRDQMRENTKIRPCDERYKVRRNRHFVGSVQSGGSVL